MADDALTRLQSTRAAAERTQSDRALYAAAVEAFEASGWWSESDMAEYRDIAARIMKSGTDEEKQAARDFWTDRAGDGQRAIGINQRIRADIETADRKAA